MAAKKKVEEVEVVEAVVPAVKSEKEELVELYGLMKKYAVNSIGDVEVKISRL